MMPLPSPGRIVHVTEAPDGTCRAAIVTEVDPEMPERVGVAIAAPQGMRFAPLADGGVLQDELGVRDHTWHWPERTS